MKGSALHRLRMSVAFILGSTLISGCSVDTRGLLGVEVTGSDAAAPSSVGKAGLADAGSEVRDTRDRRGTHLADSGGSVLMPDAGAAGADASADFHGRMDVGRDVHDTSDGGAGPADSGGSVLMPDAGEGRADALTECPAPYVFCDSFEDGDAQGWTGVDSMMPATWVVRSDTNFAGATTFDIQQGPQSANYHYEYPLMVGPWTDQTVTAWVKPTMTPGGDLEKVGICARFTPGASNNDATAYCLFLRNNATTGSGVLQLARKSAGDATSTSLRTSTALIPLFTTTNWYRLTLSVSGESTVTLTGSVGDARLISFTDLDNTVGSGGPALVTRSLAAAFDDVQVSLPGDQPVLPVEASDRDLHSRPVRQDRSPEGL